MQAVYQAVGAAVCWVCMLLLVITTLSYLWLVVSDIKAFQHVLQKDMWLTSGDLEYSKKRHPKTQYKKIWRLIIAIPPEKKHIEFA